MLRTSTASSDAWFHYQPADFLQEQHDIALSKFQAGFLLINKTRTDNPKIRKAKKALSKAKTVDKFMLATELFRRNETPNKRISQGMDLLFAAAKIVRDAQDAIKAASLAVELCNVGVSAAVCDVSRADVARDVARARLSAPALESPIDKMHRVVLSASEPVEPKPAAAGQKRPADKVVPDLTLSSDDEDNAKKPCLDKKEAPAGGMAQPSNAAGKAAKEVEYAWDIMDEAGDGWHDQILVAMEKARKTGKCTGFAALDEAATDQLRTLPVNVAELLLNKLRDETKHISDRNVSAWIVKHAKHLRNQWNIYDSETIYAEMEEAYKARNADHRDEDESVAHDSDNDDDVSVAHGSDDAFSEGTTDSDPEY